MAHGVLYNKDIGPPIQLCLLPHWTTVWGSRLPHPSSETLTHNAGGPYAHCLCALELLWPVSATLCKGSGLPGPHSSDDPIMGLWVNTSSGFTSPGAWLRSHLRPTCRTWEAGKWEVWRPGSWDLFSDPSGPSKEFLVAGFLVIGILWYLMRQLDYAAHWSQILAHSPSGGGTMQ